MRTKLLCTALASLCVSLARADYNPVPLTPSSFTQDIVLEKGAPPPLANFTTVTIDQGTNNYANTFFEQGYIPSMPMLGLPPHGTSFVSASAPNYTFLMPPDYRTNNCAFVGSQNIPGSSPAVLRVQVPTASLKVVNPTTSYVALSILYAGGGNGTDVSVTIHHADGSSDSQFMNTLDWFNGNTLYAWIAKGRISVDGSGPLNTLTSSTQTKLFTVDVPCTSGSPVTSIDFAWTTNSAGTGASNYRVFVFAVSGTTDGSTYTPIAVSGFNADAVIEAVGTPTASYVQGTTVTLDGGPNNSGSTFYEQGFAVSNYCDQGFNGGGGLGGTWNNGTYTGLPHPGETITAGNRNFVMPPSYVGNCCVFYGNYAEGALSNGSYASPLYSTVNIALTSPQTLYGLSFLGAAGNGPAVANVTLDYNDGTTQTGGTLSMPDWFPSSGGDFVVAGRVAPIGPGLNNVGNNAVKLSHADVAVSSQSAQVTNITLQWASGGRAAIFAISAQSSSGGSYNPIPFSGFNGDCVVEKEQVLFPGASFKNTTATMDLGTRNGNFTWYEQGWVTNGTYASLGLPASGSAFNSLTDPTHHYQLASYTGNNAVLIDTNHQTAMITPATPTAYNAFAVLTAGASIGGANVMTNVAILMHADGTAETNNFFGYDWFNTSLAPAYITHARADTRHSTATSLSVSGNQTPRLFETVFPLQNPSSPVTNILLQYKLAGGANWTTYVLGVSATTNAVQPVLGPLVQLGGARGAMMEGSNVVLLVTSELGTAPYTNQWQFSTDNGLTWTNLRNGGTVSGVDTLGLTNSSLAWSNAGMYRLVATNAGGFAISAAITLGPIYSMLADITQPGDPILAYQPNGGSSPAAEGVANAIDNLIGTNRDGKYLNYGANGAAPFAGPVGLVVSPALGKTVVSVLRVYTANDHSERNPADYGLEGSNDGGTTWTPIAGGALALPGTFNGPGWGPSVPPNVFTQALQEVHFPNTTGYFSYRLSFTNAVDNTTANSIQLGEVELLGVRAPYAPVLSQNLSADLRVYAGASPTLAVAANGYPANLSYQWYLNNAPISGATSASYTLVNVQPADSGKSYKCIVANDQGQTPSATAVLTVLTAPTSPYATNIMHDSPLAWFRLNEGPDDGLGNNGVVAYDHYSGHNGFYTNVTLAQTGSSVLESDTAMLVGQTPSLGFVTGADSGVEQIPGIDFAKPTNNSVALSVEAWVKASVFVQSFDAGIVTKGYGGSEQFNLDCGGNGTAHSFRFFVRDANGATHGAISPIAPEQDVWHHLVGVLDEANGNVLLYVDGLLSATGAISSGVGLLSVSEPMSIGSRRQGANTNYNLIFYGTVDEAAVYNYALSSNQVLAHFYAAGIAPRFTAQPTNTTVSEGATATFSAAPYGSPTLSAQWYQSADGGISFAPLTGKTATTLTLANVPASYDNYQYYVQVSNSMGTTNSVPATLRVVSGRPQLTVNVPNEVVVYAGRTLTLPSQFLGTLPITYQWYKNGSPLANDGRISGAVSDVLTIANVQTNDAGTYQVFAHNAQDGGSPTGSGFASVLVQTVPGFNNTGLGWMVQTNANTSMRQIVNNVLTLTDGGASEATSAFYNYPLYIGGFKASFTYQDVGGGGADGFAFVMQNDPRGPAALGGAGGALGLSGITPSAALTFNIFNASGMSFGLNGAQGLPYTSTAPLDLRAGNPVRASVFYNGSTLSVVLTDATAQTSFSTNIAVNLPAVLGDSTAYVGFTGADGGTASTQTVGDFTFTPVPMLAAQVTSTNTVLLSWPASVGGFALLQQTGLVPGAWSLSPAVVNQAGTQYQAVVSPSGGARYFRLVLAPAQP